MSNKRLIIILLFALVILLTPFIAMQFSDEVNWTLFDFIIAGLLLFSGGTALEFLFRKIKNQKLKVVLIVIVLFLFILIWTELAVGIFGTPLAGS